eukprot:GFUD01013654.1.p1 GENE.GFUD01013654.1~~GFUD01013654.1.p1  ORF type:complete len:225 (-),score=37.98 GFUD01013654.1:254-928(-)
MKSTVMCLCVLLAVLCCVQCTRVNKTRLSCNTVLENKNVSFEYNFYPGNQLEPGYPFKSAKSAILPSSGDNKLTYTNGNAWRTEKCGDSLCIVSLEKDWEHYYLYMSTWPTGSNQMAPQLMYYEDIQEADPPWTVQFDINCEDCNRREHCYIIHRYKGNSEEKNYGRLFVSTYKSVFGYLYDHTYEDWFDWAVHVHDHVPAGAGGPVRLPFVILANALLMLTVL